MKITKECCIMVKQKCAYIVNFAECVFSDGLTLLHKVGGIYVQQDFSECYHPDEGFR